MNRFHCLIIAGCLLAAAPLSHAAGSREQSLIEAVDRAVQHNQKHRSDGGRNHGSGRGRDGGHHGRDHHRGRPPVHSHGRRHAPQHPGYHTHRRRLSEYDARRIVIRQYGLGVHSAHCHDGYWTLIGDRYGHGSIRVVLDAFSGQVVGYFPLDTHRGWRW